MFRNCCFKNQVLRSVPCWEQRRMRHVVVVGVGVGWGVGRCLAHCSLGPNESGVEWCQKAGQWELASVLPRICSLVSDLPGHRRSWAGWKMEGETDCEPGNLDGRGHSQPNVQEATEALWHLNYGTGQLRSFFPTKTLCPFNQRAQAGTYSSEQTPQRRESSWTSDRGGLRPCTAAFTKGPPPADISALIQGALNDACCGPDPGLGCGIEEELVPVLLFSPQETSVRRRASWTKEKPDKQCGAWGTEAASLSHRVQRQGSSPSHSRVRAGVFHCHCGHLPGGHVLPPHVGIPLRAPI